MCASSPRIKLGHDALMRMPRKKGKTLLVNKALYGLRKSPLLWQRDNAQTLREIGYTQVPHEPCHFIKNGVIIFFYVYHVVVLYQKKSEDAAQFLIRDPPQDIT